MNVYMCDISDLMDLPGSDLLETERRRYMMRYLQAADRARCLAAGLMMRRVLGREEAALVRKGEFGKLFLPGGPDFSISHSGSKVVLAVDQRDIGVDIEQISPWYPEVARRVFTPAELAWLEKQKGQAAFYRLWTGKEAVMKALGLGFQLPPESFEILPDSAGPNRVCGRSWHLHWREMDNHMLCIASESPEEMPEVIPLSRLELIRN